MERRAPSIFGYWHLQVTGQLNRSQSLSEAHPYQSLSTPGFTSPPCKQTISPGFPDPQSQSSLWSGFPTQELEFLTSIFQKMGTAPSRYEPLNPQHGPPRPTKDPPWLHSRYIHGLLSTMVAKYIIKSVSLPPRKIYSYLPAAKNASGLRMSGVYSIPCDCLAKFILGT